MHSTRADASCAAASSGRQCARRTFADQDDPVPHLEVDTAQLLSRLGCLAALVTLAVLGQRLALALALAFLRLAVRACAAGPADGRALAACSGGSASYWTHAQHEG